MSHGDDKFVAGLALGALLGGAAALIASAAGSSVVTQRRRVVVGGVDLTNVDGTQPFIVDFSVGAKAANGQKRRALARLRTALVEIQAAYPQWVCQAEAVASAGRFVLHVQPLQLATNQTNRRSFA